jgi:heme/copper-type cytochrome/quinol oxidase subunit 2
MLLVIVIIIFVVPVVVVVLVVVVMMLLCLWPFHEDEKKFKNTKKGEALAHKFRF